jgi:hypothetical protein
VSPFDRHDATVVALVESICLTFMLPAEKYGRILNISCDYYGTIEF